MRDLKRNRQKLHYALFAEKTPILDEDGFETGDYTAGYGTPVEFKANISSAKGDANVDLFGLDISYQKTISTCSKLPIEEGTLIWHEAAVKDDDGESADYIVVAVAKSLNTVVYALQKRGG